MTGATLVGVLESAMPSRQPDARQTYSCSDCGHRLCVFGGDRHRVYFELGDERFGEPVMNGVCPACGQGLPGKNATGARS
jgi:predicted RNA-binding Zn-ribbon protein involved in translation (DUF1610 family)